MKRPPQPEGPRPEDVGRAFHDACLAELEALKPGNVHRFGEGHRMSVADFEASAGAAAPLIAEPGLGVGTRIRLAVEATMAAVGQNTNLGILLLSAPLAAASLDPAAGNLQSRLVRVLGRLSVADASEAYQGIRHAKPGGLGEAPRHDVASEPEVTLLEAMRAGGDARPHRLELYPWLRRHLRAWPARAGTGARTLDREALDGDQSLPRFPRKPSG